MKKLRKNKILFYFIFQKQVSVLSQISSTWNKGFIFSGFSVNIKIGFCKVLKLILLKENIIKYKNQLPESASRLL